MAIALLLGVITPLPGFCQNNRKELKSGNKSYESSRFSDAETQYRKAVEVDSKYFGEIGRASCRERVLPTV